ncbi:TPA: hypothetical protein DEO28_03485 [Candidatus Dependentiae bacterium]|nr:MAG: 3-oxoacyl-[acyl-carrier-protein] synthase 2 [candidate division TM6 bacterium GW2011_GWF2_33_332]HBS48120.1 hypothetical protein [Candidatus Dependentiae bacterium]HBZ73544.1 hypothetical protein [Candidatus Dependentiae bacterium]
MAEKNRVVITGIGLVTPTGNDTKQTWQSILNGKSGISQLDDSIDAGLMRSHFAGSVKGEQEILDLVFPKVKQRKTGRFIHLAAMAAHEAAKDAKINGEFPAERSRIGSYVGVGIGGLDIIGKAAITLKEKGVKSLSPILLPQALINEAPSWVGMELNLQGPMVGVCNACASGADAVGLAFRSIKDGYADYMFAGGCESSITPLAFASFGNMRVLSNWQGEASAASRPFSQDRCGFVLAEGAGILVLERLDLALARNAKIYAEIVSYGSAADSYHVTAMHPEGRGAESAIRKALNEANIEADKIGYVNAHGTGTLMNDSIEVLVLKNIFGDRAKKSNENHVLVSSTKSMTGHMLGATGAVEAAFCALALNDQKVPPTINISQTEESFDLDFVQDVSRDLNFEYALSNSFGFGGGNAALIFKKFKK